MKTNIAVNRILGAAASLGILLLTQSALSQTTNLQFTGVSATDEGNIQLTWTSVSNEVYQIQEADSLIDTNTGSTTWNLLYDEYPSQGTNTFWLDTGNYNLSPQILNPKDMPMRFYRIVDEGQDSLAGDEPIVSITSPSIGTAAVGELTVTVTAYTDQPIIAWTKLYVDGQEMLSAVATTNYTEGSTNYQMTTFNINTCEWGNEPHVLFATAETDSGYGDEMNSGPVLTGHGVSAFVPILFSNLITRISFSQPSFDPSSGETQQVSAVFAANSDWTLNIVDINSNVVLTTSGSGTSMAYNWDGTGTGETNLPAGIYFYFISAETNGESDELEGGGSSGGSGSGSPPSPDFAMLDSSELWAVAPDSDNAIPLALYPPGFDTNGFTFFSASPSEMSALSSASSSFSPMSGGGFSPDGTGGGGSGAAAQNSPAAPNRPPNNPMRGIAGIFGIGYDTYTQNGTNGVSFPAIPNEPGIPGSYITLANGSGGQIAPPLPQYKDEANNFINEMQLFGWKNSFLVSDSQLTSSYVIGSGTPFNQVNLGVLLCHGNYGINQDYMAGLCEQMYFPITAAGQFLRMSQMNLGGSGANGLKWFAIMACDSLYQHNWSSMQSHGIYPYNSNLHLLLGTDSIEYTNPNILKYWGQYMLYGSQSIFTGGSPMTVKAAWYLAAQNAYTEANYNFPNTITFAVAGDSACQNDSLQSYSTPGGSWTYNSQVVWSQP